MNLISGGKGNRGLKQALSINVKKVVSFVIALAIFFSPIQIPLSDISFEKTPTGETVFVVMNNAQEIYQQQNTSRAPQTKTTYTKGESTPSIVPAIPSPLLESLAVAQPEPEVDNVSTSTDTILVSVLTPVSVARRHTPKNINVIAAEQVANGDSASELTSVTLDENSNIIATVDAHGAKTTAEYNVLGAPVKVVTPDGTTNYYSYDSVGNLTGIYREQASVVASNEKSTLAKFVSAIIKPLKALANIGDDDTTDQISIAYDAGNLTSISNGETDSVFEYDVDGLIEREIRNDGSTVDYYYDELGNVVEKIESPALDDVPGPLTLSLANFFSWTIAGLLPDAFSETTEYNDISQLTKFSIKKDTNIAEDVAIPEQTVNGVEVQILTPATSTPATSTEDSTVPAPSLIPDIVAWVQQSAQNLGQQISGFLSLSYAETSNDSDLSTATTTDIIVPAATATTSSTTLDVVVLDNSAPELALPMIEEKPFFDLAFTYDIQGNIVETKTESGITTTYRYNSITNTLEGKLLSNNSTILTTLNYTTDSNARVISVGDKYFSYTADNMLSNDTDNSYQYDERGNRTGAMLADGVAQYTYDGNRLLKTAYATGRTTNYAYDERGAVVAIDDSVAGNKTLSYTIDGSISSIASNNETVGYTHDAIGRRVSRTSSLSGTINYAYTGSSLKKVTNEQGVVLREYFYTPTNLLVAVKMNDAIYSVFTDRNHSIVGLSNEATGEYLSQSYDVWGAVTSTTFPVEFDLGYIGAFSETSLGFSILGPRVYDPTIGRFLSKDPLPGVIIDSLSQNEYIYAKNDPLNQYDPTGHASELTENSNSPKRALVDTKQAIEDTVLQLESAQALQAALEQAFQTDTEDADIVFALTEAVTKAEALQAALVTLREIKVEQEQAIFDNENQISEPALPVETVQTVTEGAAEKKDIDTTSTTTVLSIEPAATTVLFAMPTASTTAATDTPTDIPSVTNTTPEEIIMPVVVPLDESSVPSVETPSPENTEPTPAETPIVMSTLGVAVLAIAETIDKHLLKAEAKKKSSKSKAKNKKAKKKVSSKAKKAQEKKTKQKAALQKKIIKIQKLVIVAASALVKKLQADKVNAAIAKVPPPPVHKTASLTNLAQQNNNNINKLSTAPAKLSTLTTTYNPTSSVNQLTNSSAGITQSTLTFNTNLTPAQSNWFTPYKEYVAVGISLIPVIGEAYDGWTIYAQKDPITGEPLTLIGNAFTIIGLGTIAGSGKAARLIGETALKTLATKHGVSYNLVNEAAEEVIEETNLLVLVKQGTGAFDELMGKVGESRVEECRLHGEGNRFRRYDIEV
jgi:RHS repeat-associated protein